MIQTLERSSMNYVMNWELIQLFVNNVVLLVAKKTMWS